MYYKKAGIDNTEQWATESGTEAAKLRSQSSRLT